MPLEVLDSQFGARAEGVLFEGCEDRAIGGLGQCGEGGVNEG